MPLEKCMSSPPLDVNQSILYRAGAGAGKTTQLIRHIYKYATAFYQQEKRWPKIVVTTFTRKATQELKERLILGAIEKEGIGQSGSQAVGKTGNLAFQQAESLAQEQLGFVEFVLSDHIYISTIDGLLSLFLRQAGLEAGHDPSFQIIDHKNNRHWLRLTVKKILKKQSVYQKLFQHHSFQNICELCQKYLPSFYTIDNLKPASLSDLTDLSVNEIKRMWEKLKNFNSHQYLQKIQNSFGAYEKAQDKEEPYEALIKVFQDYLNSFKETVLKSQDQEIIKKLRSFFGNERFYQMDILKKSANDFSVFNTFAKEFVHNFEELKKTQGFFSIEDLQMTTLNLLREKPEAVKKFSKEWDYWLIDEYQDTTPPQAKILDALKGSSPQFIVGDPQQSIYLFRGARSEVFKDKQMAIKDVQKLNKNYRSSPSLLYFFNDFFKNMSGEFSKMLPGRSFNKRELVATFVRCFENQEGQGLIQQATEWHNEAVIAEVIRLLNQGAAYSDICVISRTNEHLFQLVPKFDHYNIPYHLFTSKKTVLRQVQKLNAILKFILNPHDDLNLIELLRSMEISTFDLYELVKKSGFSKETKNSLWQAFLSLKSFDVLEKLQSFLRDADDLGVTETLKKTCVEMMNDYKDPSGDLEVSLWKYFVKLKEEQQKPSFNYLQFATDIMSFDELESDLSPTLEPNRLQLMTVHKSKGLEFPHVFIPHFGEVPRGTTTKEPFFVWKNLWGISLKNQEESKKHSLLGHLVAEDIKRREKAEEERLLYVAMTRAKKSVVIFCSKNEGIHINSWASSDQIGRKDKEHYSYEIKDFEGQIPSLKAYEQTITNNSVRDKLKKYHPGHFNMVRTSVSALLEKSSVENKKETNLADQSQIRQKQHYLLQTIKKMDLGTSYHKVLQALCLNPYLIKETPEKIIKNYFSHYFQKDQQQNVIESLEFLLSLKQPPIKKLLSDGCSEWPFLHRIGDKAIEGKIDLWGIVDNVLWIVDYKTGRMLDDTKASGQLHFYGQALAEKYKQSIKLVAIYLLEQKVAFYS